MQTKKIKTINDHIHYARDEKELLRIIATMLSLKCPEAQDLFRADDLQDNVVVVYTKQTSLIDFREEYATPNCRRLARYLTHQADSEISKYIVGSPKVLRLLRESLEYDLYTCLYGLLDAEVNPFDRNQTIPTKLLQTVPVKLEAKHWYRLDASADLDLDDDSSPFSWKNVDLKLTAIS